MRIRAGAEALSLTIVAGGELASGTVSEVGFAAEMCVLLINYLI
jgi:hypothetical protein